MKKGWEVKTLGEVCDIFGGGTPKTGIKEYWADDIVWVGPRDLGKLKTFNIFDSSKKISKKGLEKSSAKLLPVGSVVMSSRAPIGYVAIAGVELATNQGCRNFVCSKDIYNKYLYYFLFANTKLLNNLGGGATFKEISGSTLKSIKIPLPPIVEQKRIVKILDKKFEAIEKLKDVTEEQLLSIKELFEGRLNEFTKGCSKVGWKSGNIGNFCDLATGGTPSRSHPEYFKNGKIKWLVSGDIHKKEIFDCDGRITEEGHKNSSTRYLPINSVMIALNGQGKTRGTVALLRTKAMCNQSLVSINPNDTSGLSSEYLFRVLEGRYKELRKMTGDAGNERRGLNMLLIRSVSLAVPPLKEQSRIVKELNKLSEKTKKLEEIFEQKLTDLEELKKSYLNEAFSGKL